VRKLPLEGNGFKGISLKASLVDEIEAFICNTSGYRSVAEFVSESTRLRLEDLRKRSLRKEA
jgi:metal-responsive CopG/Arc/MetJ family transcriptional regulator